MSKKSANQATITRLFKGLPKAVDEVIQEGFEQLLDDGVQYCLDAHAAGMSHLDMGEGYGWVLLKNGKEVKRKMIMKGSRKGYANDGLTQAKRGHGSSKGWTGFILASLKPAFYFNIKAEFFYMRIGMGKLSGADFNKYFKQVVI